MSLFEADSPKAAPVKKAPVVVDPKYEPIKNGGRLTPAERLRQELARCHDDEDDDDDTAGGPFTGFGEAYLQQFGWKKGQPIREGAAVEQYAPKVTGGFVATNSAKQDLEAMKLGSLVVRVLASAGTKAPAAGGSSAAEAAEIVRIDGSAAEVEYVGGRRDKCPIPQLRHAGSVEAATFRQAKAQKAAQVAKPATAAGAAVGAKRGRDEPTSARATPPPAGAGAADAAAQNTAWIVPKLVVRVVEPADGEASAGVFEPFKATVVRLDRSTQRILLSTGAWVAAHRVDSVVPKLGKSGLIVSGVHTGKRATVAGKRVASDDGSSRVPVTLADGSSVTLPVESVCDFEA